MEDLKISLPLYEGPLDLLLDLIRRQKLDIYDIPIAKVTEQYLAYMHLMEEMNVDVASEFILIAAQLIYIKSRLLLPPDPDASPEEQEDPRAELVRRLIEYEKFKNAAQMLYQREMLEKLVVERERHHRFKNLVVAATGTGKTIVAALDYKRLRDQHGDLRLL